MPNPYDKYLTPEDRVQNAVITYLKLQFPHWTVIHSPSEASRTPFEIFKAKFIGLTSGISDLLIPEPRQDHERFWCGLAIELKAGRNKATENQLNFQEELRQKGWRCEVCTGSEAAIKLIQEYSKMPPIKF